MGIQMDDFAQRLAVELGDGWVAEAFEETWRAEIANGATKLLVRNGPQTGKITISGLFPSGFSPDGGVQIQVSGYRDPASIARDIHRRLLPRYREALKAALERQRAEQNRRATIREIAERLAASLDAKIHGPGSCHELNLYPTVRLGSHASIRIEGPNYISLEARITQPDLSALEQFIRALQQ